MTALFDLKDHGVTVTEIHRNLPARCTGTLFATRRTLVSAENGALVYSGIKTGRSPKDKQVVKHPDSEADMLFETQEACRNRGFAHLVSEWTVLGRFHVNTRTAAYFNR